MIKRTLLVLIICLFFSGSCKSYLSDYKPSNPFDTVEITPVIEDMSKNTDHVKAELNENVGEIVHEADNIHAEVNEVEAKVPPPTLPSVKPHLNNIRNSVVKIDESAGELSALNIELDHIKSQLSTATGLVSQMERISKKYLDDKLKADEAVKKMEKRIAELEQAESNKTRTMLRWIIGLCVVASGAAAACIFIGRMSVGITIGIAAAGTLAMAVAVSQYLEWIALGGLVVIGLAVAYIGYQLFLRQRALNEVVHTNEMVKEHLPENVRKDIFGSGAIPGKAYEVQSSSTENLVQTIRKSFKDKWEPTIVRAR